MGSGRTVLGMGMVSGRTELGMGMGSGRTVLGMRMGSGRTVLAIGRVDHIISWAAGPCTLCATTLMQASEVLILPHSGVSCRMLPLHAGNKDPVKRNCSYIVSAEPWPWLNRNSSPYTVSAEPEPNSTRT